MIRYADAPFTEIERFFARLFKAVKVAGIIVAVRADLPLWLSLGGNQYRRCVCEPSSFTSLAEVKSVSLLPHLSGTEIALEGWRTTLNDEARELQA
jgi:hypothetical protein